jgi:hypothetical protein
MQYDYVVTLKRDKEKYIDLTSIFLCVISIISFLYVQFYQQRFNLFFTIAAFILSAGLFINIFVIREKHNIVRYKNWLILAGIFWIGMPFLPWFCIIYFLMALMEYQVKYPLEVGFSNDIIVINTVLRQKFSWNDFTNIMLKDGLLTMDFKNNRLLQKETVDDEDQYEADEEEFNEYCRLKLRIN